MSVIRLLFLILCIHNSISQMLLASGFMSGPINNNRKYKAGEEEFAFLLFVFSSV